MNFSLKNFLLFLILYIASLFVGYFIATFLHHNLGIGVIIGGHYSFLLLPFPTVGKYIAVLPREMLEKFAIKFNFFGILMDIFVFIFSFYIVFKKKVNVKKWWIIFAVFNSLIISLFYLKPL